MGSESNTKNNDQNKNNLSANDCNNKLNDTSIKNRLKLEQNQLYSEYFDHDG